MFEKYKAKERPLTEDPEDIFQQYWRYSSALKQWFIGFGAGVFVLLASNPDFLSSISGSDKSTILMLIFIGVAAQVILAILNKFTQFYLYLRRRNYLHKTSFRYMLSYDYSSFAWIDILGDVITLGCFVWIAIVMFCNI
jgi:hypothetical protein